MLLFQSVVFDIRSVACFIQSVVHVTFFDQLCLIFNQLCVFYSVSCRCDFLTFFDQLCLIFDQLCVLFNQLYI